MKESIINTGSITVVTQTKVTGTLPLRRLTLPTSKTFIWRTGGHLQLVPLQNLLCS